MVISGSDVGEADAGVATPDDGVDAADAGAAEVGADEAASVGPGAAVAPLAAVAFPPEDGSALGAAALPALAFDGGAVVAAGFVALAAAGGCAAASDEFVAFGAEEFPCAGAGPAAPPCGAFAGGAFGAGEGVWPGFFSKEGL